MLALAGSADVGEDLVDEIGLCVFLSVFVDVFVDHQPAPLFLPIRDLLGSKIGERGRVGQTAWGLYFLVR